MKGSEFFSSYAKGKVNKIYQGRKCKVTVTGFLVVMVTSHPRAGLPPLDKAGKSGRGVGGSPRGLRMFSS